MMATLFFLLVFYASFIGENESRFFIKNSKATIRSLSNCYNFRSGKIPVWIEVQKSKYNRTTQILNINTSLSTEFDDEKYIDVKCSRWINGEWSNNFISYRQGKACTSFVTFFGESGRNLMKKVGLNPKCPLRKGFYIGKNINVEIINLPFAITLGAFNATITLFNRDNIEALGCLEVIIDVKDDV